MGCLNEDACNYDEFAIYSGFCEFPDDGFDCDGICLDDDEDGVCNFDEVSGCTDPDAINFNDDATDDDGSCIEAVPGCTIDGACNYDPLANLNDGSCDFASCTGCLTPGACNYDPDATYPGECDFVTCAGLTRACNYDATATYDNSTCDFESCLGCIYPGALNSTQPPRKTTASACLKGA